MKSILDKNKILSDKEFFEQLYRQWYEKIFRYITYITHDTNIAEEITQEIFMVALKNIDKLRSHPNIGGWIFTTSKNITKAILRKKKKRKCEIPYEQVSEKYLSVEEQYNESYDFLSEILSDDELELIIEHHEKGTPIKGISDIYGISYAACKMRLHRVYKKIKNFFIITLLFR